MQNDALSTHNASDLRLSDAARYGMEKIGAFGYLDVKSFLGDKANRASGDTAFSLHTSYNGPVIPPMDDKRFKRRTVVLCFDGTGAHFDLVNSNVIAFYSLLKKGDFDRQLVYYHSGIGTYTNRQTNSPIRLRITKTLNLMFANDLEYHVMDGYHFLMQNYRNDDKICIFGFSRGAYTARALAGMIHKVGLLPAGNIQQVPFAYDMYKEDNELGWRQSVAFKRTFSIDVDIAFVGVWDTVASVGLLPRTLPFTKSNTAIKVFRHALALDECRVKFMPSLFQRITQQEAERGDFKPPSVCRNSTSCESHEPCSKLVKEEQHEEQSGGTALETSRTGDSPEHAVTDAFKYAAQIQLKEGNDEGLFYARYEDLEDLSPDGERDRLEQMYLDRSAHTDVLEVWFAGCHCDVGGGSVPNDTPHSLARIPLRWMIRECFRAKTGIQFEADSLRQIGLDARLLYPEVIAPVSVDETASSDISRSDERSVGKHPPDQKHDSTTSTSTETDSRAAVTASRCNVAEWLSSRTTINHDSDESKHRRSKRVSEKLKSWGTLSLKDIIMLRQMEYDENTKDMRQPIYDQLQRHSWWWALEYLPVRQRIQGEDRTYKNRWRINRGRPRTILQNEPLKIHSSVKMRMEELGYTPCLEFEKEPIWVD